MEDHPKDINLLSPSGRGWGLFQALFHPFWMSRTQQDLEVSMPSRHAFIGGVGWVLGSLTVLLQLFFSSLTAYVIVNIAIRCFGRLPFTEAARRQWMKDHGSDHKRDDETACKGHHQPSKGEVWKVIKLQTSICVSVIIEVVGNVTTKIYLFCYSTAFLFLSKETKEFNDYVKTAHHLWRPTSRPDADSIVCEKSVVFMRHGESVWNLAFNRPISLWMPLRILYLFGWELLLGCERDSVILDSPLSTLGQSQAGSILRWLEDEQPTKTKRTDSHDAQTTTSLESGRYAQRNDVRRDVIDGLNGSQEEGKRAIVVSSNLRRAISTALIGLNHRWNPPVATSPSSPSSKIYIHSSLQEATRNADGYSLTSSDFDSTQNARPISVFEKNPLILANRIIDVTTSYASTLDQSYDTGSKQMLTASLLQRLRNFANWICDDNSPAAHVDIVVAVGHSIWFRKFFTLFLPPKSKLELTTKKLPNCAILQFKLVKYKTSSGSIDYWIDPESFVSIFDGFQGSHPLRSGPDGVIHCAKR